MRLIDADKLIQALTAIDRFARSDAQAILLGRVYNIVSKQPTIGGWISVDDKLPNKGQIVIASDGEHTWDVGMYKSFCGKPSEWNWKKNTIKTVLWWMPKDGALLEPPEQIS